MESYAVKIRRQLHMYPEIGFDLPRTLELLHTEMERMGVEYTEKYGKSSIVATVNPEKSHFTIGVRADMDALPITERNDVPYRSRIDGQMHACGHDVHTAIALDTLRKVYEMREEINCRVKFLFQSAEEYPPSGAKLMADDGVMDGIDCIVALHCDTGSSAGQILLTAGAQSATSDGFYLDFYGKSAHVANQQNGVDSIMMAVRAYTDIEMMLAKSLDAREPVVFNVGKIEGGETNNVIADHCSMFCTLRTWRQSVADDILNRIRRIIGAVAESAGGRAEFRVSKHYPIVYNDEKLTERVRSAAERVVGAENVLSRQRGMGGEDFSYFAMRKPGCMFRLGICNEARGIVNGVHTDHFDVDEDALEVGSQIFLRFIRDNMNGFEKNQ